MGCNQTSISRCGRNHLQIKSQQSLYRKSRLDMLQSDVSVYWVHVVDDLNTLDFPTPVLMTIEPQCQPTVYSTLWYTVGIGKWMSYS